LPETITRWPQGQGAPDWAPISMISAQDSMPGTYGRGGLTWYRPRVISRSGNPRAVARIRTRISSGARGRRATCSNASPDRSSLSARQTSAV
jgi:hypothetical protein